jgi:hypothetical protein
VFRSRIRRELFIEEIQAAGGARPGSEGGSPSLRGSKSGEGDSCETKRVSVSPSNSFTILVVLKRVKDLSAYWRIYFSSSGALVIK